MATEKKLKLDYVAEGGKSYALSVADPKDGLDLAAVTAASVNIMPVLEATGGLAVESLKQASIVTTTVEVLA